MTDHPHTSMEKLDRIVSFRVSWDEYQRLLQVCAACNIRTISELTRRALQEWVNHRGEAREPNDQLSYLTHRIEALERRVSEVAAQVDQLMRGVRSGRA